MLADHRGESDGGDVQQRSLERGGDRARVRHVIAEVRAEIDAGDDEIGPGILHQLEDGQVHAVGRRTVDDPLVGLDLQQPERPVQRQRVRSGALLAVGRDDDDIAHLAAGRRQLAQTFAVNPVVVGDQNARHLEG